MRTVKKRKLLALAVMTILILGLLPGIGAGETDPVPGSTSEATLYAGQHKDVGKIYLWNDGSYLYARYALSQEAVEEGWEIMETHLAVADEFKDIPQNRAGNPIPGRFASKTEHDPGEPFADHRIKLEWSAGTELFVAAHAAIEKTECEVLIAAPYGASQVVDYEQGLRYDYTQVRSQRSNPDAVLTFSTGQNEANFFSLGFPEDRDEYPDVDDAWIIVEFEEPVLNRPGDDLRVIEDTWGLPYPDETVDVWVSKDGDVWHYLGSADNQTPWMSYHTITDFDLDDVGLDYIRFVKLQDTSQRADFADLFPGQRNTLDGFDVNAIVALQDHVECTTYDETAWAGLDVGSKPFPGRNWATYFSYIISEND